MSVLQNAPLIEAIFELRWGRLIDGLGERQPFAFTDNDSDFFVGEFHRVMRERGFRVVERPNPPGFFIPHLVTHRFRREANTWPCYQIGLGIFTVNQINEGYDWLDFRQAIVQGIDALDHGHPDRLPGLPGYWVQLRYRDGFRLGASESPIDFLCKKMSMRFQVPDAFTVHEALHGTTLTPSRIAFEIEARDPESSVVIELQQGTFEGAPGFVMDTTVRSMIPRCPAFNPAGLLVWLDRAHSLQKHAFTTLIAPEFAASFDAGSEVIS